MIMGKPEKQLKENNTITMRFLMRSPASRRPADHGR